MKRDGTPNVPERKQVGKLVERHNEAYADVMGILFSCAENGYNTKNLTQAILSWRASHPDDDEHDSKIALMNLLPHLDDPKTLEAIKTLDVEQMDNLAKKCATTQTLIELNTLRKNSADEFSEIREFSNRIRPEEMLKQLHSGAGNVFMNAKESSESKTTSLASKYNQRQDKP